MRNVLNLIPCTMHPRARHRVPPMSTPALVARGVRQEREHNRLHTTQQRFLPCLGTPKGSHPLPDFTGDAAGVSCMPCIAVKICVCISEPPPALGSCPCGIFPLGLAWEAVFPFRSPNMPAVSALRRATKEATSSRDTESTGRGRPSSRRKLDGLCP